MGVNNIIAIIFFIIIGTSFVRYAAAAGIHRPKLKKGGSGHKPNDDVLLRALSDFGVVRRSLNPLMFERYSSIKYLKDQQNIPKVENKKNRVIEKLKLSVTLRDNILHIFSYLLHGREDGLTEEQYTSLQMLYELLKKNMVYMYNLLPILSKLNSTDKNQQTRIILLSLMKNLPSYLQCTAKYLANEIQLKRIDLNMLLKPTAFETFNYLANIDSDMILKSKLKNDEEMASYDKYSNITQKALGPVFVKLLYNLHANKLPLSQELFGLILINLPNPSDDPVLEENIRYLYDLTKNNIIDPVNWNSIGKDPIGEDAYTLVFSVLTKILNSNVPMAIKDAAAYVYHHLKLVMVPTHVNSNFKYMHRLIAKDIDIGMLLSAIIPQEFGPDAVRMKDRLLTYFMQNYRTEDLNKILKGFNKFAYNDPLDLLLAFLTRLANRVPNLPNTNLQMLQHPVMALVPALIVRKYDRFFTPFVSPEIDVLILLESLKTPEMDPVLRSTIDSIKHELIAQPQISVLLSTLMPTEKEKCLIPKQCLMNTFEQVHRLQTDIPLTLTTKIKNVAYILKKTSPVQYQSQSVSTQYSIKPMDLDLYIDREVPVAMGIETDNMYTNNVPIGFNGIPYVWNIDKYVSKVGPAVQVESQVGGTSWGTKLDIGIGSIEAKVSPTTTTDQDQVTEAQVTEAQVTEGKIIEAQVTEGKVPEGKVTEGKVPEGKVTEGKVIETQVIEKKVPEEKITEARVTEGEVSDHVPVREDMSDHPLTSEPSLTTSVFNVPSQTTYNPMQTPRKEQPYHTTSIRKSIIEEHNSEIEYSHTPESVFHEKEVSHLPSTSEEVENQTSSPEEKVTEAQITEGQVSDYVPARENMSDYPLTSKPSLATSVSKTKNVTKKKSTEMTTVDIKSKHSQTVEEKTSNENVSSAIILPPNIETDQPLQVHLSNSGIPIVTTGVDQNTTSPGLILPEIKELLKSPDINNFLKNTNSPVVTQVLQPLSAIFGKNYIKKILKDVDPKVYPTNIALLSAILEKATIYPEVANNPRLINVIHKYIATIEYVSPTILLPIVVSSKKLTSDVVYSTFNPNDLTHSEISENLPDETSSDIVIIPLVNPKILLQSINPSDPFANLLPTLEEGDPLAATIQPLKMILTSTKITEILGPDFQPLIYPTKGALLITLLHKLRESKTIQLNPKLKSLIEFYIQAIEVPSMTIQVSEDKLVNMMSETTGHWQPELTSLTSALPAAQNPSEVAMMNELEKFLDDPTLLEKLHIANPPLTISRGEFLHKIILSALSGNIRLEKRVMKALRYYKDKVEYTEMGALPVVWMWVETYVVKAEVQLGNMIQETVNFKQLTHKEKLAYNDVITYLAQNPNLLQDNEDFDFEKYKTQGQFVKGLFKHLLKKPQINKNIKKDIQIILPRVIQTGAGAVAMPSFSEY